MRGAGAGDSGGSGVRLCRILDMDFREIPEDELRRTPSTRSSQNMTKVKFGPAPVLLA
jgi:hypothetical protein